VVTKYKTAAGITDKALQFVASQCVDGASIIEICNSGETVITGGLSAVYGKKVNGKAVDKGIAFPVCVSVNEIVSNNSPLSSEVQAPLKAGDIVKIDLGCHIDGYIALAGHTFICGEKADSVPKQVAPVVSDVATAAYNAMLVAVSMIKEGGKGSEVTAAIQAVSVFYVALPFSIWTSVIKFSVTLHLNITKSVDDYTEHSSCNKPRIFLEKTGRFGWL